MIEFLIIQPTLVSVADALEAMRNAYADCVVADRMTYEIRRSDGTFDTVSATLRIDHTDEIDQLRYETSGFTFHARDGVLTGAGLGPPEPRRALVIEQPGRHAAELLTATIPTGPLPQLWTFDESSATDPALGVIRFTNASAHLGTTTITGETALGAVSVEINTNSGRFITLRAWLRDGSIELRAAPIEPGNPQTWAIETENRRLVSRIDQLAPNLAILDAGDVLPDVSLQHPDGMGVTLAEWQESPPEGERRAPWSLILFADATSTDPADALRLANETLRAIMDETITRATEATPAERFWLRSRPLIVLVMPDDAALDNGAARPDLAAVDVLYSTRPDLTIDRLPLAPIVAVGIDRSRVIGAISPGGSTRNNGAEAPLDVDQFADQLLIPARNTGE